MTYTIHIRSESGVVNIKETVQSNSLPRVIHLAHACAEDYWYDMDDIEKGTLTITNAVTGITVWTENLIPIEV